MGSFQNQFLIEQEIESENGIKECDENENKSEKLEHDDVELRRSDEDLSRNDDEKKVILS